MQKKMKRTKRLSIFYTNYYEIEDMTAKLTIEVTEVEKLEINLVFRFF